MKKAVVILTIMTLFTTLKAQKELQVVSSVDLTRYSGTWFEIARLPVYFESKLKCITATYSLREDGNIDVLNAGRLISNPDKISSAKAKAFIPDKNVPGKLKVQFFWPFKGDYWIMYLDENYKYVLVGEPSLRYLWILARGNRLEEPVLKMLLKKAADSGYDLTEIIMTVHDCN